MASDTTSCVFVTTNKNTRICLLLNRDDSVSLFKDKICKEHEQCFPSFGKIIISALKVCCGNQYYHLPDSMILSQAFQAISNSASSILSVDVTRAEDKTSEVLTIIPKEKSTKRKLKISASSNKSCKKPTLGDDLPSGKGEVEAFGIGKVSYLEASSSAGEKKSSKDRIDDATSESFPNSRGEKITNTLLLMAVRKENEMGEKDSDEATKSIKDTKKIRTKKAKAPAKEDTSVVASSSGKVDADVVIRDEQENEDKVVKKSKKKPSSKDVEEA